MAAASASAKLQMKKEEQGNEILQEAWLCLISGELMKVINSCCLQSHQSQSRRMLS